MRLSARFFLATFFITTSTLSQSVVAQEYNALAECRAQSLDLDQIHACMDGYLDVLDGNIRAITDFLNESLTGDALEGLNRSQRAFTEFRRQNCLWYLEFPSPRIEAEQIAKNCLATMSRQRLQELQGLVTADNDSGQTVEGFYVYGAERNSFQPCGSEERFWVEGDANAVGLVQQTYLSVATSELQLLHVTLAGEFDVDLQVPDGHAGTFELSSLIEMRVPTETDCRLPNVPFNADASGTVVAVAPPEEDELVVPEPSEQEEPEQQLTAYFGDWIVDCVEFSSQKSCNLEVALLQGQPSAGASTRGPRLFLNRLSGQSTNLMLEFPAREIDSPALIRWQVDAESFGDIVGSEIRVDQLAARQIVNQSEFLDNELLPAMIRGEDLTITVLASVDAARGDAFQATLIGLTRALEFADGFLREQ